MDPDRCRQFDDLKLGQVTEGLQLVISRGQSHRLESDLIWGTGGVLGESAVNRPVNAVGALGLLHEVELAQLVKRCLMLGNLETTDSKPSCVRTCPSVTA